MERFFSIFKNQAAILSTLLVLFVLAGSYFYIYIPDNEKTVQDRHFRCLQNIDYNVHNKIETSETLINNLLSAYPKINTDSLNRYIKHYPQNNFTLVPIINPKTSTKDNLVKIGSDAGAQEFSLYENKKFPSSSITDKIKNNKATDTIESHIIAQILKNKKVLPDSIDLMIGIRYKIKQFIKPLLTPNVFDHYVVFYNDKENEKENRLANKVVYETFPSGLSYLKKDSLLQTKNGIVTPGIRTLSLSGADYRVFTQAINVDANSEFIIAGLVSDKNYQKEKNQLPLWFVLLLLTTAFGMVALLPWIKLYHMGNKDKLTIADGISSVLVSMLLMSLLFFVVVKYSFSFHFNSNYKVFESSASTLANKITSSMDKELNNAYGVLIDYNAAHHVFDNNIINLGTDTPLYNIRTSPDNSQDSIKYQKLIAASVKSGDYYHALAVKKPYNIAVKEVFWLDSLGMETSNWNTQNHNAPHIDYSERDYFKNLSRGIFNYTGKNHFYLDQVVSKTRNVFTSIIAIKLSKHPNVKNTVQTGSGKLKVKPAAFAAMTFAVKSLDSVVMPDGFMFAIIDAKGEVRYHSMPQRNLNENLKREFADSSELVSCLEAGSDTTFAADYYGEQYNIKIQPLQNLPYFIVIFEDQEHNNARDTEPYAFTLSMLICFMLFVIVQFAVVFFVSSKKHSFFKRQFFDTSWVAPSEKSHHQYNIAIIANSGIIALLVIFFTFSSFLGYFYTLLFSAILISVFLNGNFAVKYKQAADTKYKYKLKAIDWLCGFAGGLTVVAFGSLDARNFLIFVAYELLSAGACFAVYKYGPDKLVKVRKYGGKHSPGWKYTNSFAAMATTRVVVTSGIPVAFFFIFSFNYEQNLDTRYRQLRFAKDLIQKLPPKDINMARFDSVVNDPSTGIYNDDVFIKHVKLCAHPDAVIYTPEDYNTLKILKKFRVLMNNTELKSNNLTFAAVDNTAFFNKITLGQINPEFTSRTYYRAGGNFITLTSDNINYPLPGLFVWIFLLLLVAIYVFYIITLHIIRKLFAINLPILDGWGKMDERLLLDNELNRLLIIVGAPGSGKLSKLKKLICEGKLYGNEKKPLCDLQDPPVYEKETLRLEDKGTLKKNVYVADMILVPPDDSKADVEWQKCKAEALDTKNALVIINHFEYNIKDVNANNIKLDFLESLMQTGHSKVIIVSAVHPLAFLDSFSEQENKPAQNPADGQQKKQDQSDSHHIPESELERWHVLLGYFRIIIEPLEDSKLSVRQETLPTHDLLRETQYTHYLKKMQQLLLGTNPLLRNGYPGEINDSLIFKLQITSHYFYTYIWQSLTKEEKFLLYDLAEDGLVNPYDDYNLSVLICKGLIIRQDGILTLFNKGFRNFILTAIGNAEVKRIKDHVKDNGKWGSLKAPLRLTILAILIFLMTSQQQAYNHLIAYVTTLGAGIPALLSIFSIFGGSNTQKAPAGG